MPTPDSPASSGATQASPTSDAKETADDAKQAASQTAGDAKAAAEDVAGSAKDAAADVAETAKQKAADLTSQAKGEVKDAAQQGKEKAEGVLSDVAETLHDTSDSLREQGRDAFADYADQAATQIEAFTSGIRDRNVGELLDEAERFARREPGLFIGGAFLLGIFGARFLKASASGAGPDRPAGGRGQTDGPSQTSRAMTGAQTGSALPTGATPGTGYATGSSVTSGIGYSTAASRTAGGPTSPSDAARTGTASGAPAGSVVSGGVSLPTTRPADDTPDTTL